VNNEEMASALRKMADQLDSRRCYRCGSTHGMGVQVTYDSSPKYGKDGLPWIGVSGGCTDCSDAAYEELKESAAAAGYA